MENELSQLLDNSIDESHLLNYEKQHSNNGSHVTPDQETAQVSEKSEITSTIVSGGDWLGNPANIKGRGYCLIL